MDDRTRKRRRGDAYYCPSRPHRAGRPAGKGWCPGDAPAGHREDGAHHAGRRRPRDRPPARRRQSGADADLAGQAASRRCRLEAPAAERPAALARRHAAQRRAAPHRPGLQGLAKRQAAAGRAVGRWCPDPRRGLVVRRSKSGTGQPRRVASRRLAGGQAGHRFARGQRAGDRLAPAAALPGGAANRRWPGDNERRRPHRRAACRFRLRHHRAADGDRSRRSAAIRQGRCGRRQRRLRTARQACRARHTRSARRCGFLADPHCCPGRRARRQGPSPPRPARARRERAMAGLRRERDSGSRESRLRDHSRGRFRRPHRRARWRDRPRRHGFRRGLV